MGMCGWKRPVGPLIDLLTITANHTLVQMLVKTHCFLDLTEYFFLNLCVRETQFYIVHTPL